MVAQWGLSILISVACEVLAIVYLLQNGKGGDYWHDYSRKLFVIFAAVNLVDLIFWLFGYRNLGNNHNLDHARNLDRTSY